MVPTTQTTRADAVRTEVVEAAAGLLREHGARGVTTRAVALAAGVQAPTIYRLFGDKDGLVDAVAEHVMAGYVAGKAGSARTDDPVRDLRDAWGLHVRFGLQNPELYVLLTTPGRTAPSPATAAGIEVLRSHVRRIAAAGLLRVDEERAVRMVHAAGTGAVLTLLDLPEDERDPGLADAVLDAVVASLVATERSVTGDGATAVAVAFGTVVPDLPGLTPSERALMGEWVARSVDALQAR